MARQKRIRIIYKKLGREKIWGHADNYPLELDIRLKGKKHLEVVIHECLHYLWNNASEEEITRKAILLTNTLWHEGYRKCDHDNSEPLQDGSK
jgi:hypothetical protein